MNRFSLLLVVLQSALTAGVPASQVRLPVDTASSTLQVTLTVQGTSDTQTRNLQGFLVMAFDNNGAPSLVALRNFDLQATGPYNFHLDYGFLGDIFANANNLRIFHGRPGPTNDFGPVSSGVFSLSNVPYRTSGTADYNATGLICPILEGNGLTCSSNIDLGLLDGGTITMLTGTVAVANGQAAVSMAFDFDLPFDEANPGLGRLIGHAVVNASAPVNLALVPRGSDWRYLDTGADLGSAWRLPPPSFDDAAWAFGPAQLGYGDGDEETTVGFGPDLANKFITTYFRHAFHVPDAGAYSNLALRVLHDDGVAVYLNGSEIYRNNLPAGEPTHLTLATVAVGGGEENVFFVAPDFAIAPLISGTNVLAVEIHQSSVESSDISFDLELIGNGVFTNAPPAVSFTMPTNGAAFPPGGIGLQATTGDSDGVVQRVEFYEGPNLLGSDTTAPYSLTWAGACAGTYTLTARAIDNGGAIGVSAPITVSVIGPAVTLVTAGSTWRFLDNGSDQGTAWRAPGFNDSAWVSGPAQLGYGDGDEMTPINGGPTTNRFITTYFRRAFNVANAGAVGTLTLRLLRDDGAVVYLNGAEVHRSNMPTGAVTHTTLASAAVGGADETNFLSAPISVPVLFESNNVLAVEVHQSATNSTDLSFDLVLEAHYSNAPPSSVVLTQPANESAFALGANLLLQASAVDSDSAISRVEYFNGTNRLGQATVSPYSFVWNTPPAGYHSLTALAVDACGARRASAAIRVRVGAFSMVQTGAVWRYLDHGTDQGTAWRARNFNDAAWSAGAAELGYGDGDEATVVSFGPMATNKYITTYFRRGWPVPDPSVITGLVVRLLRDDGAVVYVNGAELFRSNLPDGPINHLTLASAAVAGADEDTYFVSTAGSGALVAGLNIIAVELHQNDRMSSDVSFDLELLGLITPHQPRLFIESAGADHLLRWPSSAVGFNVEFSDTFSPVANWQPLNATAADDGTWKTVERPNTGDPRFYRLRQ